MADKLLDDSEIALMRQQLKTGNAEAKRVLTAEKYPVDPRIAEAMYGKRLNG